MKRINLLLIGLLIAGTALISSCKKEAQIEKNLWKKGGEWNIVKVHYIQSSPNPDPDYNFEQTLYDYGTYTFNKDGSGNYTITVEGDFESESFTYSNTEETIKFIVFNQQLIYDIIEWEKDKMTIAYTESFISNDNNVTSTVTYNLEKK